MDRPKSGQMWLVCCGEYSTIFQHEYVIENHDQKPGQMNIETLKVLGYPHVIIIEHDFAFQLMWSSLLCLPSNYMFLSIFAGKWLVTAVL